jgi:hypothetical protein
MQLFTDDTQLQNCLEEVLESWPLYRDLKYNGAPKVCTVPPYLSLHCLFCENVTYWQTKIEQYESNIGEFATKKYTCRNCGDAAIIYAFRWMKEKEHTVFVKVGQWPELEETVSTSLAAALPLDDLKIYKTALRLRNFNLGIGAVAYMRRVVENRMNDMLGILHEVARTHNGQPELLAKHEEIKKDKRFSVKVEYAGDLLPTSLRPSGHPNPIAILHELTSEGLHSKTDAECVEIFDACRKTFEYVFGKMRLEVEQAAAFVKEMVKLSEKRGQSAKPKPAGN